MQFPNTLIQFEEFRDEDIPIELVLDKYKIPNDNKHLSFKEVPDAQDINFLMIDHPINGVELYFVTPVLSHMLTESRVDLFNASYLENINPYLRDILNKGDKESKKVVSEIMANRGKIFNELLGKEGNYTTLVNLFSKFNTDCLYIKACIYGNGEIDDEIFPICPSGYKSGHTFGIYDVYEIDMKDTDPNKIIDQFKSNTSPVQCDNITFKRESDLGLAIKYGYDKKEIGNTEGFINFYNSINLNKSFNPLAQEKINDKIQLIPICFILNDIKFPLPKIENDYKFISTLISLYPPENIAKLCEYSKYINEIRVYQVTNSSLVLVNNDYNYMYSSLTYEDINKDGYEIVIENLLKITGKLEENSEAEEAVNDE